MYTCSMCICNQLTAYFSTIFYFNLQLKELSDFKCIWLNDLHVNSFSIEYIKFKHFKFKNKSLNFPFVTKVKCFLKQQPLTCKN